MLLQNKHNYPDWVLEVIEKTAGEYNPGVSDFTPSSLLRPSYMRALEIQHRHELENDASDLVASATGTAIHAQWEKCLKGNDRYIVEERFYRNIVGHDGKTYLIGGQIDLYDTETNILWDTKNSSVYKLIGSGDNFDYEAQMSVNRWIMNSNNIFPNSCSIGLFIRDWSFAKAKADRSYPQSRFAELPLPFWSIADTEKWIKDTIQSHIDAEKGLAAPCSERDRWARPGVWAVMKDGRKSAVKLHNNEAEAIRHVGELGTKHSIVYRPGEDVRCESYCNVSRWCSYYNSKEK